MAGLPGDTLHLPDLRDLPGAEEGDSDGPDQMPGQATPADSERSESEITDPFEEFHSHGALQTEESQPTVSEQPVVSSRTQFLRAVSLFSPVHQLAMLEVREEQGVSLLERSTTLTAESLDEVNRQLAALIVGMRRRTLQGADGGGSKRGSEAALLVGWSPSPGNPSSRTLSRVSSQALVSPRDAPRDTSREGTSRKASTVIFEDDVQRRPSQQMSGTPAEWSRSRSQSAVSGTSDANISIPGIQQDMDPALVELLRELWTDPEPRAPPEQQQQQQQLRMGSRGALAGAQAAAPAEAEQWPDVLSGLWRMLDSYEEFVCSPPNFHAFRQEKPHWLDQEPIPWSVRESAREKCTRWLQACPIPA